METARDNGSLGEYCLSSYNNAADPSLTVVICTHKRPRLLRKALESIVRQVETPAEILVVNNDRESDDEVRSVIARFHGIRYFLEPIRGLDFARNRALREATGDVVAFLDDDATADPGWTAALRTAFARYPGLGICTGRVLAIGLGTEGEKLIEANGGFDRGSEPIHLPMNGRRTRRGLPAPAIVWAVSVGSGVSLAVHRKLAVSLGGFDEGLDLGCYLPGGGDHDMLWRVLLANREIHYQPLAVVRHEHRATRESACDQILGHQKALCAMLMKSMVTSPYSMRLSILGFLVWRLIKPGVRVIKRITGRDPLPVRTLLGMWRACWFGIGAYYGGAREAARRRETT